jgi:hypothetical protein
LGEEMEGGRKKRVEGEEEGEEGDGREGGGERERDEGR